MAVRVSVVEKVADDPRVVAVAVAADVVDAVGEVAGYVLGQLVVRSFKLCIADSVD